MHDQGGMAGDGWFMSCGLAWLMLEWTGIVVVGRYGEGGGGGVIKCLRIIAILEFPSS